MEHKLIQIDQGIFYRPQIHMDGIPESTKINGLKVRGAYNTIKGYAVRREDDFHADSNEFIEWLCKNTAGYPEGTQLGITNISRFFHRYASSLDDFIIIPREFGHALGRVANKGEGAMYTCYDENQARWAACKSRVVRKTANFADRMDCHRYGIGELANWIKVSIQKHGVHGRAKEELERVIRQLLMYIETGIEYRPTQVHLVAMINKSESVRDWFPPKGTMKFNGTPMHA